MTTEAIRQGVVESHKDPLRAITYKAARRFATADGESVKVTVNIIRASYGAPVIVSSHQAMPRGRVFRYLRQHVNPLDTWRECLNWIDSLPEDYCLEMACADMRAIEWRRLEREYLSRVPCIEVEALRRAQ